MNKNILRKATAGFCAMCVVFGLNVIQVSAEKKPGPTIFNIVDTPEYKTITVSRTDKKSKHSVEFVTKSCDKTIAYYNMTSRCSEKNESKMLDLLTKALNLCKTEKFNWAILTFPKEHFDGTERLAIFLNRLCHAIERNAYIDETDNFLIFKIFFKWRQNSVYPYQFFFA